MRKGGACGAIFAYPKTGPKTVVSVKMLLRSNERRQMALVLAFSSRRPLATTSRLAPMSANTAIHMVALPNTASTKNTALMPSASAMFCHSTAWVRRDRRMVSAMRPQVVVHDDHVGGFHRGVGAGGAHREADVGLGQRRRVVDAVAGHAGRRRSAVCSVLDGGELVLGQQVAARVVDAGLRARWPARWRVVAGQHDGVDAQRLQLGDRLRDELGLIVSATANSASTPLVVGQQGDGAALRFVRRQLRFERRACTGRALRSAGGCRAHRRWPSTRALHAAPGQRLEVVRPRALPACAAPAAIACDTGWSERAGQARGQRRDRRPRRPRSQACQSTSRGLPSVMVPVLSSATALSSARLLQVGAALDQDAAPRRRRQRR